MVWPGDQWLAEGDTKWLGALYSSLGGHVAHFGKPDRLLLDLAVHKVSARVGGVALQAAFGEA